MPKNLFQTCDSLKFPLTTITLVKFTFARFTFYLDKFCKFWINFPWPVFPWPVFPWPNFPWPIFPWPFFPRPFLPRFILISCWENLLLHITCPWLLYLPARVHCSKNCLHHIYQDYAMWCALVGINSLFVFLPCDV